MAYPDAWFTRDADGKVTGSFQQVALPADGTPAWVPLVPKGKFQNARYGEFIIRDEYLQQMEQHFRDGFPGPGGIPGDENGVHGKNPAGAYAWCKDVKLEEDGLHGLVGLTPLGVEAVGDSELVYISPHFSIGDGVDPEYGRSNCISAFALCSSPAFLGQPQLTIKASAYVRVADDAAPAASAAETTSEGDEKMPTQEEFDALQAQVATLTETLAAKETDAAAAAEALVAKDGELAEFKTKFEALEASMTEGQTEKVALETRLAAMETQLAEAAAATKMAEAVREMEALRVERQVALPDGTVQTEQHQLTPEAVQIAASAKVDPVAHGAALLMHVTAHGGALDTVSCGAKPNLQHIAASAGGAGLTDGQRIAAFPERKALSVRASMATGMDLAAAELAYHQSKMPR
jgi:hypothetical protein